MGTSSARPDDLDAFARDSRAADDELRTHASRLRAVYNEFQGGTSWGQFDAHSLIDAFGRYVDLNEVDARWVTQIATAFRHAGGDGSIARLPDAAIAASLRAAGLGGGRESVTFDDPVAYGFPPTSGYADDPVNTASGNFLLAEADLGVVRTYNSRSDQVGAFGPGWSSWADARLRATAEGAAYAGPDGQRALFPRQGAGYGRVLGVPAEATPAGDGLEMRWFDGRRWLFDSSGRPVSADGVDFSFVDGRLSVLSWRGRSTELTWTDDRISAAVTSDGRFVQFSYADGALVAAGDRRYEVAHGRVVAVIDADGVVEARNTYDVDGRVVTQVSRFGHRTHFAYLPGAVTATAGDGDDSVTNTYTHDAFGRLLSVIDGHGQRLSRTYDQWGNPVTVTDRDGSVTVTEWDERCHPVRRVQPDGATFDCRYDDEDRVTEVASAGAAVRYRYQGAERTPSKVTDAEGGITRLDVHDGLVRTVTDPDGVTISLEYGDDAQVVSATDADGGVFRLERDRAGRLIATVTPLGRRTSLGYDENGWLSTIRDSAGALWHCEHSAAGRRTAVIDPTGARHENRYGSHGSVEESIDPLGHRVTRRYDEFGNVARVIAPDGAKWDYGYDALSRLTSITDPAGATWLREYDVVGNLIGTIDPVGSHYAATFDEAGRVTGLADGVTSATFEFDTLGRATAQIRPDGTAARAGYDRCGRRTTIEDPAGGVTWIEYTKAGRIHRTISPRGTITSFEYDACGRLASRTDGAGHQRTFRYNADHALVEQIEPDGQRTALSYDAAGRLIQRAAPGASVSRVEYDAAGRPVTASDRMTGTRRFRYDHAGRLTAAIDGLGNTTRYAYNERGWLISTLDPEGGTTTREYDEVGRLTAETDPLGRTTAVTYNPAGRLRTRTDPSGRRLQWAYDASGRVSSVLADDRERITIERDALGRPVSIDEADQQVALRWDTVGRMIGRSRQDMALSWSYDADGNRTELVYPDGTRTRYEFDPVGRVSELDHPLTGRVSLRRDPMGRLVEAVGAGFRANWRYESGELVGYSRDGRPDTNLTRDQNGRIVAVTEGDRTRRFTYDAAGQLQSADDLTFEYDRNGRLVLELAPQGRIEYTHDRAGQLTAKRVGDATTRFDYDGAGRRTSEFAPDGQTRYRWDDLGRLTGIDKLTVDGQPIRRTDVKVDPLGELAEVSGTPMLWDSADPLSPPCWMGDRPIVGVGLPWTSAVDWQGNVGSERRDPWGAPAAVELSLGFRGEVEFDGLVWLRDRLYSPSDRCFLQPDALPALPGTAWAQNPYHYAGNDPLNLADPLGLRPVTDEELRSYRDQMDRNAWEKTTDWVGDNWEYLAAGAMVVGGIALMFTGVGGPAGIALMAASGGLVSAGVSAGVQKYTTGDVNWGQVGVDALVGAAAGGAGGAAGMLIGKSALLATTSPPLRGAVVGGLSGAVSGMVGRGVAGDNPFDPRGLATDLLIGAGAGAVGGRLGAGRGAPAEETPEPPEIPPFIYRGGGTNPGNFRLRPGEEALSFRDSLSDPLPPARPVFTKPDYVEVDTSKLPPGSVVPDGVVGSSVTPPGHVSVYVNDPQILQDAATKYKFPK